MSIYPQGVQHTASYSSPGREERNWQPIVTLILMGITIFVFVLQILTEFFLKVDLPAALGMKVNALIIQGQVWRLITPIFLHASILHLGFNMYALYVLGPALEQFYGRRRFLALYLLAGYSGNVASFLFSDAPSLGASTAVFGLLAAQGVFFYQNKELFGSIARRSLTNIVTIAAINLVIGLSPGIDNWGHLGGLVGGLIFAWFSGPYYQRQDPYVGSGIENLRTEGEVFRAGALVLLIFSVLAGYKIFLS